MLFNHPTVIFFALGATLTSKDLTSTNRGEG